MQTPTLAVDDPIEAARALLPLTASWGNAIIIPTAYLITVATLAVGALVALRPLKHDMPWWERARQAYVARMVVAVGIMCMPVLASMSASTVSGPLARIPSGCLQLLAALASFCGVAVVAAHVETVVCERTVTLFAWMRAVTLTLLTVCPHVFFPAVGTIIATYLLPDRPFLGCSVAVALSAFAIFGGGFLIARLLGLVRVASPRLHAVAVVTAATVGTAPPRVFEFRSFIANAYAIPGIRSVGLTTATIESLTEDALLAVLLHEVGHLTEPQSVRRRRRILHGLQALSFIVALPLAQFIGTWSVFVSACLALIAYGMRLRFSRKLEGMADAVAIRHETRAGAYAHALERLHAVNARPAVLDGATTHPDLYDRLLATGVAPSFPRPVPPDVRRAVHVFWFALAAAIVVIVSVRVVIDARSSEATDEGPVLTEIGVSGGSAFDVARLASLRAASGDVDSAVVFFRAASVAKQGDPFYPADAALTLAPLGRCDDAQEFLHDAEAAERGLDINRSEPAIKSARRAVEKCGRRLVTLDLSGSNEQP